MVICLAGVGYFRDWLALVACVGLGVILCFSLEMFVLGCLIMVVLFAGLLYFD